jgi:hypothetical protein
MYTVSSAVRVSGAEAKSSPLERYWGDDAPAVDRANFISDAPSHGAYVSASQTEEVE